MYAIFAVEHKSDACGLDDVIRVWWRAGRLDRFLPQAGSLQSDEDLAEPSRDSAEAEKVPWAMTYWNKFM